jgi:hypothetical protein
MPKGGKFPDVKRGASTVGDDEYVLVVTSD